MTELTDVQKFLAAYQGNKKLWIKLNEMTNYVVQMSVDDMAVVRYKYRDQTKIGNEAIKQIITENGYQYIANVMDTIEGFDFQVLIAFADLIGNLKGTRVGIELVLRLMGFSSSITEWWEASPKAEPWSYKITVGVDASFVPNLYTTLDTLKEFSRNYVFSQISNIDLQFGGAQFAQAVATMGGFVSNTWTGSITQKARP